MDEEWVTVVDGFAFLPPYPTISAIRIEIGRGQPAVRVTRDGVLVWRSVHDSMIDVVTLVDGWLRGCHVHARWSDGGEA